LDKPQWKPIWQDVFLTSVGAVSLIAQIALCFFFYNSAGLDGLLYAGWAVVALGVILTMVTRKPLEKEGGAPEGESWLHTTVVVDSGVYGIVRHPMYLGMMLVVVALILISQHWLSLICAIAPTALLYGVMLQEEKSNVEKFGDDYKRYMQNVPRMNLLVGIIRLIRR
jgi:protein-S-isoprenylcysteine O-methyltransferase Ste14